MLVMTFLSMLSNSITAVPIISLHTLSVSLLMKIFFTCFLITPTPPPMHPNHYRDHLRSVSWSSLSNLKGELLIILSFLIFFQDIFLIWASRIYQMYYLSLFLYSIVTSGLLAVDSFLILQSNSQLIFTCSFSNTASCPHLTLYQT